jgi:hypothetical protein
MGSALPDVSDQLVRLADLGLLDRETQHVLQSFRPAGAAASATPLVVVNTSAAAPSRLASLVEHTGLLRSSPRDARRSRCPKACAGYFSNQTCWNATTAS